MGQKLIEFAIWRLDLFDEEKTEQMFFNVVECKVGLVLQLLKLEVKLLGKRKRCSPHSG